MNSVFIAVLFACVAFSVGVEDVEIRYETRYLRALEQIRSQPSLKEELTERYRKDGGESIPRIEFKCSSVKTRRPPQSVHELRPQDIGVIGALGDSVNAGNGLAAENPIEVLLQNRGEAFLVGGGHSKAGSNLEDNVITLATILKKFNPNLKGWSYGFGHDFDKNARYNKAVPGAKAIDLVDEARRLVKEMKEDMKSFHNDWKVISLFIGGNDLCQSCESSSRRGAVTGQEYQMHIQNALDILHAEVPKVYVNVVAMFDITPLASMKTGAFCDILQETMCPCPSDRKADLGSRQKEYAAKLADMINSGRFDTRDDFTVVLQPHMRDSVPPKLAASEKYDPSWLSFDCFHPARKFHQAMAILLWNTMLTDNHEKSHGVELDDLGSGYYCPTKRNPYLYTTQNSHPEMDQLQTLRKRKAGQVVSQNREERTQGSRRVRSELLSPFAASPNQPDGQYETGLVAAVGVLGVAVVVGTIASVAVVGVVVVQRKKKEKQRKNSAFSNPGFQIQSPTTDMEAPRLRLE